MAEPLPGLIRGDDLKPIHTQKAKQYDEKTITANSKSALDHKLTGEKEDGWEVLRDNKKSIRLKKTKSVDRQIEDDIWCLLHDMGFKELNEDRTFAIKVNDRSQPRQLDVFAKDDETAFIVECTHSRDAGPKSVKSLIDKIGAIRPEIIAAVHRHYGREPPLKIKFAIATRNMDWRPADRTACDVAQIGVITHDDLVYFRKLTNFLKTAARYQFLGRYLRGEGVDGLRSDVPATRGKMGGHTFYNFLMSPHDLLKITYISHKAKTSSDDMETYQRMVKPPRLKAIGRYIDEGGKFPTNIVINIKTERLNFDVRQRFGDTATGTLHLPGLYGLAWVIDGQHRLYGYAYSDRGPDRDNSVVPVLAYENLPLIEEIQLFVDINTQQVKVPRNLVNEIISGLNINDPDPEKRLEAIHAQIVLRLGETPGSPLRDRILRVAQDKDHFRCLTQTSLVDVLTANNLVGSLRRVGRRKPDDIEPGPFSDPSGEPSKTMDKAIRALSGYLNLFATGLPGQWHLGDDKGGYICTNNGIRALLVLFRRILDFIESSKHIRVRTLDADDVVEYVAPYVAHLIEYFKYATSADIAAYRTRGSSLSGVDENCSQMMMIVHDGDETFRTKELIDYINNRDTEGTKEAEGLIQEINRIMYDDVIGKLKLKHGNGAWWMQGVPKTVRNACDQRYNEESDDSRERHQFLTLSNYPEIIQYGGNWEEFKDNYSFPVKGRRKKPDQVAWIQRLNIIRNITHHVEKGPLTKAQVEFVRRVHRLVKKHVEGNEKVVSGETFLPEEGQEVSTEEAA